MKARYDTKPIKITKRYKKALKELMKAHCSMMRKHEPEFADCWTWGTALLGDMAKDHLEFEYGGVEDEISGVEKFSIVTTYEHE